MFKAPILPVEIFDKYSWLKPSTCASELTAAFHLKGKSECFEEGFCARATKNDKEQTTFVVAASVSSSNRYPIYKSKNPKPKHPKSVLW